MAEVNKGYGATLKLNVTEALKNIQTLQKAIQNLKKGVEEPINVDVKTNGEKIDNLSKSFKTAIDNTKTFKQGVAEVTKEAQKQQTEVKKLNENWLTQFATGAKVAAELSKTINNLTNSFRNTGKTLLTEFTSFAGNILETVGFQVTNIIDDAIEQEKKLQQSRIGFGNMFPGQDIASMIQRVRTTAAESPGLNSGDLADYINQLGAVSGGSFNTAFNATMGILKTVQYGGGDANAQMGYIIKNIRDVVAKGKATAIDVQQFNRAMPLLQKSLGAIGASDFLKNGTLTITKENADRLMEAFAQLNTEQNPAYNIFEQTGKTLAGIQEEFSEKTSTMITTSLEELGFFDALQQIMREDVFDEMEEGLSAVSKWVKEIVDAIDWDEVGKTVGEVLQEIKEAIGDFGEMLKQNFGNTEFITTAIRAVGEFFKGLIDGATELGKFLEGIRELVGDETFVNLANQLGRAVTQGKILTTILGWATNGLGTFSNILSNVAFMKYIGGKGSSASVTGASALKPALGRLGIGATIGLLGDAAAEATQQLKLFGDRSTLIANELDIAGNTIEGAVYGSVLGPFGALGGAALGLVDGFRQAQERIDQVEAEETEGRVKDIVQEGGQAVLNAAISTFRTAGGTFDEQTDAAVWIKNQVIDYLNKTPAMEWDAATIYDRFVSAYRQKLGHEVMVGADETEGFWDIQGKAIDFVSKNAKGETVITQYGQDLTKLIRDYNLVGYDSIDKLNATSSESLIREYLQGETLNLGQLDFLKNKAKEFEETTGASITASRDEINDAIERFGGLGKAIDATKDGADEALNAMLKAFRHIQIEADETSALIAGETKGDRFWTKEVARQYLGDEGAETYETWRKSFDPIADMGLGPNANRVRSLFGTSQIEEIVTMLGTERDALRANALSSTGEDQQRDTAAAQAIDEFFVKFKDLKDYASLAPVLEELMKTLLSYQRSSGLISALRGGADLAWVTLKNTLPFLATGGKVVPIFRANGGRGVDSVPAYLQPGEFVQRASAVNAAGLGVMNALNNGDLARAYTLLGSKIHGTWDNSRHSTVSTDNRRSIFNRTYITNNNRSGRISSYHSLANKLALGY